MKIYEKKFKKYINENEEESFYDEGSLLARIIEYPDEISDYLAVDEMIEDFGRFAASYLGDVEDYKMNPEYFTFETINEYFPEVVDSFFKTEGEGRNWLWLSAMKLLSAGFFGDNETSSNLYYYDYKPNRSDNKWRNWYEDYGKKSSISDADEMAYLFASWGGKDPDTEDISDELEQANELSYPLEVDKSYGIHSYSYSDQSDFPVITTSAEALQYEEEDGNTDTYMYSDGDDSFRSESKPFDPRDNMFDIFRGPEESIAKFLSKFGD